ncbi:CopD family protein [Rhodococcus sp. NPDC058514]|uniref:CopD family protein n=1 Tax=unclassified Rhodococcus (in: high G+C Gram-positive bacteria) TaxID=192944 RepID=UPI003654B872
MTTVGAAGGATRWRITPPALLLAAPAGLAGVGLAWLLAAPAGPDPSSLIRVLAVLLGSAVLGLAALEWLQRSDRRPVIPRAELWRPVAALAGAWTLAEVALVVAAAAETTETGAGALSSTTFGRFLGDISAGQIGAATVACTAAIAVIAALAFRRHADWPVTPVAVLAAVALAARPVTGHMATQVLGSLLGAAHALAAALWLGPLVAMALLLRARGAWATLLPRYSDLAWRCVAVLAVTGVIDAAVRLGGPGALVGTGYGRIVLAKAAALLALGALGWWWRRTWVPAAGAHRVQADDSLRRAVLEVLAMAVAFGLAAALATTA